MRAHLLHRVMWRRLDAPGLEVAALSRLEGGGHRIEGTVLLEHSGAPVRIEYEVTTGPSWLTRSARVDVRHAGHALVRQLEREDDGHWRADGASLPAFDGVADVDLAFTPSTNLLPVRRLDPPVGTVHLVTAAWVRFPELDVVPLRQTYTRLAATRWRYESDTGFRTEIETDAEHGLVVRYPPAWERVAED